MNVSINHMFEIRIRLCVVSNNRLLELRMCFCHLVRVLVPCLFPLSFYRRFFCQMFIVVVPMKVEQIEH